MSTHTRTSTRKSLTAAELKARATKRLAKRAIVLVKPEDLLSASQEKLCLALSYLDVSQLSTAKATELIAIIKGLFDISQVLQGKPTAIHASNNRKALADLIPAVLKEAERRGLSLGGRTIEGEVVKVPSARGQGTRHTPRGGTELGPIQLRTQSDFSKILEEL